LNTAVLKVVNAVAVELVVNMVRVSESATFCLLSRVRGGSVTVLRMIYGSVTVSVMVMVMTEVGHHFQV